MNFQSFVRGAILLSVIVPTGFAASVDQLVVFGDSLSDTGNVAIATGGLFPGPNYWNGRFTDGPTTTPATNAPIGLWVDQLAAKLGVSDPQPFLAQTGGTDYAIAGANTGSNGLSNITDEINYFTLANKGVASSTALYTIWGGANDLYTNATNPVQAADSLAGNIRTLAGEGAKTFLWLNLPPLGITPRGTTDPSLNAAVSAFNSQWAADIAQLRGQGINVIGVDIFSTFLQVGSNPGAYGFTNLTDPAQGVAGIDPNTYLFWDTEHPTTAGHAIVANVAYNDLLVTSTPEPASLLVTALGMAAMMALAQVRAARRSAVRQASN